MSGSVEGVLNGALIQEMRLNILSNNIANINTVGFKEDKLFQIPETGGSEPADRFSQQARSFGDLPVSSFTNFSQGKFLHTGNPLDLSLEGEGFFSVEGEDTVLYTRTGDLSVNNDGLLITQDGLPVLGQGGKIYLSSPDVVIDERGNIIENGTVVDSIKIVKFSQPNALQKAGLTRFAKTDPNIVDEKAKETNVMQGFIEQSNVDAVNSMTEMIDVLRGYETYQKVIQSLNDTALKAINDVGRLA
ncbi:flagellar basal-body rod protein FlgF [Thermodesulfobacteriota bacterium]